MGVKQARGFQGLIKERERRHGHGMGRQGETEGQEPKATNGGGGRSHPDQNPNRRGPNRGPGGAESKNE
jgi:hypothetical protein